MGISERGYTYFEDLKQGDLFWSGEIAVEREEMLEYNRRNDPWPFHIDVEEARKTPFGDIIASGGYTISLMFRSMQGVWFGHGDAWQMLGGFDWQLKFVRPVRADERLRCRWTLLEKIPSRQPERGVWRALNELLAPGDDMVLRIEAAVMMIRRPGGA